MTLRIGIAGLGFGANLLHTCLTRDDCVVAAVADRDPARRAPAEAKGIRGYDEAAEMVREAGLDALVLATAPHFRAEALSAALEAGLPVFVEKPLAATPDQARALVERCRGGKVMVGFSFRFHAPVAKLIETVRSGALGRPMLLNAEYLFDWLPPADGWLWDREKGGGFFNENSCHLLDVVRALVGMPREVFAHAVTDDRRPNATAASVSFRTAEGCAGALTLGGIGTGSFDDFPRLDIALAEGQARLRGRQHMWTSLRTARRGSTLGEQGYEPEALGRTRYSAAFDHFLAAVRGEASIAATPEDGLSAVRFADAIYRAIETGQPQTIEETT